MKSYLVQFHSESGDHYVVGLFTQKPTKAHLDTIARQRDFDYEGLLYGSFDVDQVDEPQPLPEPDGLEPLESL